MLLATLLLIISSSQSQARDVTQHLQEADKAGHFLLDVSCGQDGVVVAVDSVTVVEDKNVGAHVIVLEQTRGKLLQHHFFPVDNIFWSEMLVEYLNTIRDGRVVVVTTQEISSEMMSNATQLHLTLLGSQHVKELTGRGQWAMAVEKGFPVLAEARSSPTEPDISEGQVHLHVQVDLKLDEDVDQLKSGENTYKKGGTCGNLLKSGHLGEFNEWQPDGCRMRQYTSAQAYTCFRRVRDRGGHTHFAFLGDSRIRNTYGHVMSLVDPHNRVVKGELNKWGNHLFIDKEANVLFEFFKSGYVDNNITKYLDSWRTAADPPNLIVTGVATWIMKDYPDTQRGLQEYSRNITLLVPTINDLAKKSTVIWSLQEQIIEDRWKAVGLTNEQISLFNHAAIKALRPSSVRFWSSPRRIAEGNASGAVDGLHQGKLAVQQKAQILLNFYCNEHMDWDDDTCCTGREKPATTCSRRDPVT